MPNYNQNETALKNELAGEKSLSSAEMFWQAKYPPELEEAIEWQDEEHPTAYLARMESMHQDEGQVAYIRAVDATAKLLVVRVIYMNSVLADIELPDEVSVFFRNYGEYSPLIYDLSSRQFAGKPAKINELELARLRVPINNAATILTNMSEEIARKKEFEAIELQKLYHPDVNKFIATFFRKGYIGNIREKTNEAIQTLKKIHEFAARGVLPSELIGLYKIVCLEADLLDIYPGIGNGFLSAYKHEFKPKLYEQLAKEATGICFTI